MVNAANRWRTLTSCEICAGKTFALTQNSQSHGLQLKWLDFTHKQCAEHVKALGHKEGGNGQTVFDFNEKVKVWPH